jgi:hypothetical protein
MYETKVAEFSAAVYLDSVGNKMTIELMHAHPSTLVGTKAYASVNLDALAHMNVIDFVWEECGDRLKDSLVAELKEMARG